MCTHSLCFFFGPGRPLAFGSPVPFAALLTPFFFGPSRGGPIGCGTGVPLAAGVAGLESIGISVARFVAAGTVARAGGASLRSSLVSSLMGVSSFFSDSGSTIARNFRAPTLRVTMRDETFALGFSGDELAARTAPALVAVLLDFRRSLVAVAVLVEDAAAMAVELEGKGEVAVEGEWLRSRLKVTWIEWGGYNIKD